AVMQCHNILRKGYSPEWILEGDIKGCFDHISHEWLLANIPMDKEVPALPMGKARSEMSDMW
ncbi:hypothetical protein, partial [Phocaeicola barnesiae]|uniref:hypothetical protein n=1 Tax=Phocaeicola barnesiae TaxID=376804 RepID=UPI00241FD938